MFLYTQTTAKHVVLSPQGDAKPAEWLSPAAQNFHCVLGIMVSNSSQIACGGGGSTWVEDVVKNDTIHLPIPLS